MKNSAIIFIFLGVMFIGIIIFAFVYLPKIDRESGINAQGFSLILPVDHIDMRYLNDGVVPFCKDKGDSITIETRENAVVYAPANGAITDINNGKISIQATNGVGVYVYPVKNIKVSIGDYISQSDLLGNVDGSSVSMVLDNENDRTYECPYLYMDSNSQKYLSDGLSQIEDSGSRICECSFLKY